ncbi:hypothetical protein AX16_008056 [Volvariella volvacea WC 439]|nr:hypothetical protein AX16_008056 [Volvariella volvacea WC 439]
MFNDPDSEPTQIDVYWFVVAANRTLEGGWLPHQQIREQMRVLNEDFNQTHVIFKHIKTTRIIQPTWFADMDIDSPLEKAMKKRFRRGGPGTLNVYTVGLESTGLLGWAAFPADFDSDQANDGIVLRHTTLPGGSYEPYNGGRTLTHEAGHWVGLYHTFQDGCDGGDDVSDTAPEAEPAYGCPIGRDTCPGGGPDPVQNFMDYSDDSCMTGFTKGQIDRLQNQLRVFRELAV